MLRRRDSRREGPAGLNSCQRFGPQKMPFHPFAVSPTRPSAHSPPPFRKKNCHLRLSDAYSSSWSFGATVSFLGDLLSVESVSSPRKVFISFPTIAHHFTLSYGDSIWGK